MNQNHISPKEIEKMITKVYVKLKLGELYDDQAWKEVYILNSLLKAIDVEFKMNKVKAMNQKG